MKQQTECLKFQAWAGKIFHVLANFFAYFATKYNLMPVVLDHVKLNRLN
jgi:hypothetical protein